MEMANKLALFGKNKDGGAKSSYGMGFITAMTQILGYNATFCEKMATKTDRRRILEEWGVPSTCLCHVNGASGNSAFADR